MSKIVSFDNELLILVNSDDESIGLETKAACHHGSGLLHRAFSILIFNSHDQLLLQKRSLNKRLWGGYWTNSCCSHPRQGESILDASVRRLKEELSIQCPLTFLYKFEYQAQFRSIGAEHELCWVFAGLCDDEVIVNSNEIAEFRWLDCDLIEQEIASKREQFTPWFLIEWSEVRGNYWSTIESLY